MSAGDKQLQTLRTAIHEHFICDEDTLLRQIQQNIGGFDQQAINALANSLLDKSPKTSPLQISQLLQTFTLQSDQGIALMELAEALLRIPDTDTQDALITEKIASTAWASLISHKTPIRISVLCLGLELTAVILRHIDTDTGNTATFTGKFYRLCKTLIRSATITGIKQIANQFVMAESIDKALKITDKQSSNNQYYSFDMLGETALTLEDADRYWQQYSAAIAVLTRHRAKHRNVNNSHFAQHSISIKLSALHPKLDIRHREKTLSELIPKVTLLAMHAKREGIGLTIDAEESWRLELSLDIFTALCSDARLADWQGLGIAVQAYQKRAVAVIHYLGHLAQQQQRSISIRLVKGAYWDTEIKQAQTKGLQDYPVFTAKRNTDLMYLYCCQTLKQYSPCIYAQYATHNAYTLAAVLLSQTDNSHFEIQRLFGMGESLFIAAASQHSNKLRQRIYAPIGSAHTLLSYLVRRLLENGANTSFIHQESTVDQTRHSLDLKRPSKRHDDIPLPEAIYSYQQPDFPLRKNSSGIAIDDIQMFSALKTSINSCGINEFTELLSPFRPGLDDKKHCSYLSIQSPMDSSINFSLITDSQQQLTNKIDVLKAQQKHWQAVGFIQKEHLFRQFISLLKENRGKLIFLLQTECGKTLDDALSELREAEDFIHYYLQQYQIINIKNQTSGLGVALCISPWNFPVAILLGQIVAALICGNTVLVKASQNSQLIALYLINLLKEAGIEDGVIQSALVTGENLGAVMEHKDIKAVLFTGSQLTAKKIQRHLIHRSDYPVTFIAETGGINCMIIDSTALVEQAVNDVIESAFLSSGQRCSALRVLYIQEEIATIFERKLIDATSLLNVCNNKDLSCDMGPLINHDAITSMISYLKKFKDQLIYPKDITVTHDALMHPHIIRIDKLDDVKTEVFGPCLHIIHYHGSKLKKIINDINHQGYGLTFGLHSRLKNRADSVSSAIECGNIYINRNTVGAIVGMQPFGGNRLSGTGPKAGGPHYLHKLLHQNNKENVPTTFIINNQLTRNIKCRIQAAEKQRLITQHSALDLERDINQASLQQIATHELACISGEKNVLSYSSRGSYLIYLTGTVTSMDIIRLSISCRLASSKVYIYTDSASITAKLDEIAAIFPFKFVKENKLDSLENLHCVLHNIKHEIPADLKAMLNRMEEIISIYDAGTITENLNHLVYEKLCCTNLSATGGNLNLINCDTL